MDIKAQKKEAVVFLNKRGRRIDLVFYGMILIFATVAPLFFYNYVGYFISSLISTAFGRVSLQQTTAMWLGLIGPIVGAMTAAAFILFISFPAVYFFFQRSYCIYRAGTVENQGLLGGQRGAYWRALSSGFVSGGILLVTMLPVLVFSIVANHLIAGDNEILSSVILGLFVFIVMAGIVVGFCVFLLFKPLFLFGYFSARGQSVRASMSKSLKIMKKPEAKRLYFAYIKSFLPALLLALPTFLLLFFIDTLPKMIIVYHRLSDELVYNEKYKI